MKRWTICAIIGVTGAIGISLLLDRGDVSSPPTTASQSPGSTSPPAPRPVQAVVLNRVIETSDLAPLLDPIEKPPSGEPFDADVPPASPVETTAVPDRIPTAKD